MLNWIKPQNLGKLSSKTQQSYKVLNSSREFPTIGFLLLVEKHVVNLRTNCQRGTETFALVEKIL